MAHTGQSISQRLKAQAYGLGFDLAGIAALGRPDTAAQFDAWLAAGNAGTMHYLEDTGAELRRDARLPHPGATHALVVAMNYGGREPGGPVARYARGDDYHEVLRERLHELHRWLEAETGQRINARPYVDSGPILERDLAQRAGLGWFGKNTCLINPATGSFLFLASLFVEFPLDADAPFEADRCGTCTRCLDACPTHALTAPRVLDSNLCISYLTIELRGAIPEVLREPIGELVYGCDICQDVCPFSRKFSKPLTELAFKARPWFKSPSLIDWMGMSTAAWGEFSRRSPIKRAKRRGFLRNVAVALGNSRDPAAVPVLSKSLSDNEPLIRGHAAWALGRIGTPDGLAPLLDRVAVERDEWVLSELRKAIATFRA
ncbi:MAG: tRNA epoxyqueuosine(34) reductase QueG [Phycisphaerae bacterium]|nr:tRNA epoxyqueuosine(34) reductase QueG [Gemmatimonadaceae bacterium]